MRSLVSNRKRPRNEFFIADDSRYPIARGRAQAFSLIVPVRGDPLAGHPQTVTGTSAANKKKEPPFSRRPLPFHEALSPGSSQQLARHRLCASGRRPGEQIKSNYFFLTGFLVAFFFAIVAFSFGLDFGAAAFTPGFFFTGIRDPPLRSLLLDERKTELAFCASSGRIIEMRYAGIKRFAIFL